MILEDLSFVNTHRKDRKSFRCYTELNITHRKCKFPVFMDNGGACQPCAKMDEAALLEYLPSDYNDMSTDAQADALKEAKDIWRREKYGAGRELSCCTEGDADCPDQVCPELGDTFAHYCNGHCNEHSSSYSLIKIAMDISCCPITLCAINDPVVAADGHTYDRSAIEDWMSRNATSPLTGEPLLHKSLVPNFAFRSMMNMII